MNCDDEANKPFCGSMGVQGFPTLKIVKPSAKYGKPIIEDYQGARTVKAMTDAVVAMIPNHVKRVQDKGLDAWLNESNDTAKAILFTEKGTTSGLYRALAVDFLGSINFAQIRNKEAKAVDTFGISSFPTLILLPGGDKESIVYEGEMKKDDMVTFLSQVASPNPDPAPSNKKSTSKTKGSAKAGSSSSVSSAFSKVSESHKSAEASEAAASATKESVEQDNPTESPEPIVPPVETPIVVPETPPAIPQLATPEDLQKACLGEKTGTCILALLPAAPSPDSDISSPAHEAQASLAQISSKHAKRHAKLFPFYEIPSINTAAKTLRSDLGLKDEGEVELIAVNGRRGWWRRFLREDYGVVEVESWVDAIRLGEGQKEKLPAGVIKPEAVDEVEHDEL
ncbi:MAG: hypothetical protein Q9227_007517 [Pyrenula ochraceoflavens]